MGSPGPSGARPGPPGETAPVDVAAAVRARRYASVGDALLQAAWLVLLLLAVTATGSRDWTAFGILVLVVAGLVAWWLRPLLSAPARRRWDDDARRAVVLEHALRHRTDAEGGADAEAVAELARLTDRTSRWAAVGYPAVAGLLAVLAFDLFPAGWAAVLATTGVLLHGAAWARQLRRGRWARRWLADPPRLRSGPAARSTPPS